MLRFYVLSADEQEEMSQYSDDSASAAIARIDAEMSLVFARSHRGMTSFVGVVS